MPVSIVCPLCRGQHDGKYRSWRFVQRPGLLRCSNPSCEGRFLREPFPVVLREPGKALLRLLDMPSGIPLSALGMMLATMDEDSPLLDILRTRSTAGWASFHDYFGNQWLPEGAHPAPYAQRALTVLDGIELPVDCKALVAGCGPGREPLELITRLMSKGEDPDAEVVETLPFNYPTVVALDKDPAMLKMLTEMVDPQADGHPILLQASADGWHTPVEVALPRALKRASDLIQVVCADAVDPPFAPKVFNLVVAIDLLESVAEPVRLLRVLDRLLMPGGLLLLGTSFSWDPKVTPRSNRLAAAVPHVRRPDKILLKELMTGKVRADLKLNYESVAIIDPLPRVHRVTDRFSTHAEGHVSLWRKLHREL